MFCIVYDITNKDSFKNANFWYEKMKEFFDKQQKIPGF